MSMVYPRDREPLEATPRKRLTGAQRATLWKRQNGLCGCGCSNPLQFMLGSEVVTAAFIDEHILPLELGGLNDLDNRALYLVDCAKAKTREDIKRIRKAARLRRDADPDTRRRPVRKMRGRGFPKDPLKGSAP